MRTAEDGSLRLLSARGPLEVPAVQGSRLLLRLLDALREELPLALLAGRTGLAEAVLDPLVQDLLAMGLVEAASDHPLTPLGAFLSRDIDDPEGRLAALRPLPVRVEGGEDERRAFVELAEAEGLPLAPEPDPASLVVWMAPRGAWPAPGTHRLLVCVPDLEGRGLLGPVIGPDTGPCLSCWQARLAAHRPRPLEPWELEGLAGLPVHARRLFVSHVLREVLAHLLDRPDGLGPGAFKTLDYRSGEIRAHRFLAAPECPACWKPGEASGSAEPRGPELPASDLVDPTSGIFQVLHVRRLESRHLPLVSASARLGDTRALGRSWSHPISGGMGVDADEAVGRALGEGLERYCATTPRACMEEVPRGWKDLDEPALSPERLHLFSPEQHASKGFPYRPPTAETPLRWSRGFSLPHRREVLLPSAVVHMPYEPVPPEQPLVPAHSHGLACGPSLDAALMAGLCELVERDAFTLFWQQQRPRPRVHGLSQARGRLGCLYDEARARGWRVRVYDLRRELPMPVFLVMAQPGRPEDEGGWPALMVGAAASPDAAQALERAFMELFQNHRYLAAVRPDPHSASSDPPRSDDVDSFEAHALFYSRHPDRIERLSFLEEGEPIALGDIASFPRGDPATDVADWSERLEACGFTVFACDLTTRDVRGAGRHVARVVVPEMVRLHSEHALPFLGSPRLEGARNPHPHPFP